MKILPCIIGCVVFTACHCLETKNNRVASRLNDSRSFTVDYITGTFRLNDKPFTYKSGSIHYPRIHPNSWDIRLQQVKALGLNAIQYYIPWNFHEVYKGEFLFASGRNFTKFSELALTHGLYSILRIGPYICGEWENGGFPYFVTSSNLTLRTNDPRFLAHVKSWFDVLLPVIKPMLWKNGGPVLMIQIENEYGLFNKCDKAYMGWLRDIVWKHLGDDVVLFTTDPVDVIKCGSIDGVLPTIDFGPAPRKEIEKNILQLQKIIPGGKGPLVNSEYYTGWFTFWGQKNQSLPTDEEVVEGVRAMVNMQINFNLYMAYGGTNFGYWNGAHPGKPVITSYDYGAPIREDGSLRPLYYALQRANRGNFLYGSDLYTSDGGDYRGDISLTQITTMYAVALRNKLPQKNCHKSTYFDECRHPYGLMCYQRLQDSGTFDGFGFTYGEETVEFDRNARNFTKGRSREDWSQRYCVENEGRPNYPSANSRKGGILYAGTGFYTPSLVVDDPLILRIARGPISNNDGNMGAGIYKGTLKISTLSKGTHISFENWGKGVLFVNGHNLGRYWSIGPQLSLFVDGHFLVFGDNEVVLLELLDVNRGCEGDTCFLRTSESSIWTQPLRP